MKRGWKIALLLFIPLLLGLILIFSQFINHSSQVKVGILTANKQRWEKIDGLKKTLQNLGYIEGQNIVYEILDAENDQNKLSELANQLLNDKPDVLIATGGVDAKVLKEKTSQLKDPPPVVFLGTLSPVEYGLVQSFTHPGANLTGLANFHVELTPKRLELLHKLLPEIRSVALLEDERSVIYDQANTQINNAAQELGISVKTYFISNAEEIKPVIQKIVSDRSQAIVTLPGFFIEASMQQIIEQADQEKIPIFGIYPSDAEQGCLASYGTSYYDQGSQCAYMVQKIIRGLSPSNIPIETPDKLNFIVNLSTAKKLNLEPDQSSFSFADKIIQP